NLRACACCIWIRSLDNGTCSRGFIHRTGKQYCWTTLVGMKGNLASVSSHCSPFPLSARTTTQPRQARPHCRCAELRGDPGPAVRESIHMVGVRQPFDRSMDRFLAQGWPLDERIEIPRDVGKLIPQRCQSEICQANEIDAPKHIAEREGTPVQIGK